MDSVVSIEKKCEKSLATKIFGARLPFLTWLFHPVFVNP